mgnify:CR=1 FL=1
MGLLPKEATTKQCNTRGGSYGVCSGICFPAPIHHHLLPNFRMGKHIWRNEATHRYADFPQYFLGDSFGFFQHLIQGATILQVRKALRLSAHQWQQSVRPYRRTHPYWTSAVRVVCSIPAQWTAVHQYQAHSSSRKRSLAIRAQASH